MMTILFAPIIVVLLTVVYHNYKLVQQLKDTEEHYNATVENMAWIHDSNLQLLKKTVKTRVANLEKRNKELEKEYRTSLAVNRETEQKLKKDHEEFVTEITRYKVWKFIVKTGMEASVYPDRLIVIADSKKAAEQLVEQKFNLENVSMIYDIVQSRRSKNEILLESYDIL